MKKPFTDDDLKRLKEWAFGENPFSYGNKYMMQDLIARLDAAEKFIERFHINGHNSRLNIVDGKELPCFDSNALDAWRKAAGKP